MSKTDNAKGKRKRRKKPGAGGRKARAFGITFAKWTAVAAVWIFFVGLCFTAWLAYDLPDLSRLTSAVRRPSVTLVTTDGQILASYGDLYGKPIGLDEVPPYLPEALLATEDRRFYSHFGLDLRGLLRATIANIEAGHLVQGGSTITQQLAKNVFLTPDRTIRRKGQEIMLALWLEHIMTKEQILTLYLNRVYFGAGTYGVDAAARKYFGKPAAKVTPFEAAMLVGMVKAPSHFNPLVDPKRAAERAKQVLVNMVDAGYMVAPDAARIAAQGEADMKPAPAASGQYYSDWVLDQVSSYVNYSDRDLVVVTTIDPRAQQAAEAVVAKALTDADVAKNASQAALVAMSPDGAVRAMVGGRDYGASQYNRATQALRPPGSTFKLFDYLAALESGMSPDDTFVDAPISVGNWRPTNFDDRYMGQVTLRQAFAQSLNSVAVQISQRVGLAKVIDAARRLGITTALEPVPSIAIGASGVSLLEMTSAYAVFANRGNGVWPYGITQILDGQGNVLYNRAGSGPGQVVGGRAASELLDMMQEVVTSGTGRGAALGDWPVAGKTGTSQDYRDAWFIGFTADLVAGVWLGNDDNAPMNNVVGGSIPARIWHDFMDQAEAGKTPMPLPAPNGELPEVALNPMTPLTPTGDAASSSASVQPLGDNTPSAAIQGVIERLKSGHHQ
jgi:penicillin-binding protein 1A